MHHPSKIVTRLLAALRAGCPPLVCAIGFCWTSPAQASFDGPYDLSPPSQGQIILVGNQQYNFGNNERWKLSWQVGGFGPSIFDKTGAPEFFVLDTGYPMFNDGVSGFSRISLTTTAAGSGLFSFNYALDLGNTGNDFVGYSVNGQLFPLNLKATSVSGVRLNAGDTFGFYIAAGPGLLNPPFSIRSYVRLTVSNFNAPVPEPSTLLGLAVGLVGLGGYRLLARPGRQASSSR